MSLVWDQLKMSQKGQSPHPVGHARVPCHGRSGIRLINAFTDIPLQPLSAITTPPLVHPLQPLPAVTSHYYHTTAGPSFVVPSCHVQLLVAQGSCGILGYNTASQEAIHTCTCLQQLQKQLQAGTPCKLESAGGIPGALNFAFV
jgi:hypothetical protein